MTNLDIAQELIMKFHKEKPEEMHLLKFSMWIDTQRNETLQEPTTDELFEELGYKFESISLGDGIYWCVGFDKKQNVTRASGKTPREALLALKEKLKTT